mmetsp:Transcript_33794/g.74879  ORF Transcript_33794/g.74879 Transcript_33794/m.74879 type:complete len:277 (-) Transcript_33794:3402-4232(-)
MPATSVRLHAPSRSTSLPVCMCVAKTSNRQPGPRHDLLCCQTTFADSMSSHALCSCSVFKNMFEGGAPVMQCCTHAHVFVCCRCHLHVSICCCHASEAMKALREATSMLIAATRLPAFHTMLLMVEADSRAACLAARYSASLDNASSSLSPSATGGRTCSMIAGSSPSVTASSPQCISHRHGVGACSRPPAHAALTQMRHMALAAHRGSLHAGYSAGQNASTARVTACGTTSGSTYTTCSSLLSRASCIVRNRSSEVMTRCQHQVKREKRRARKRR